MFLRCTIFSLLLLTVNLFSGAGVQAASVLKTINRADETTSIQLFFHCDSLPETATAINARRVDVEFHDTTPAPELSLPATDGRLIKIVSKELPNKIVYSLYFRYPPQQVTATRLPETGALLVDILLGNQLSTSHPELSTKLQGVSVVQRSKIDALNPVNLTEYAKNWLSFFTDYELPVVITPPPHFHIPPFPLAVAMEPTLPLEQWLSPEIQSLAQDGKWTQVCLLLREQINTHKEEPARERLVLSYADALLRAGEYRDPYFLLQRIIIHYPESKMAKLAHFLQLYQQAIRGDHIDTYFELIPLAAELAPQVPFADDITMFLAELALISKQYEAVQPLLDGPSLAANTALQPRRALRLADLLYAKGEKAKSLTAYQQLGDHPSLLHQDPLSLANFADSLYTAKRYPEAAKMYMQLGDLLSNQTQQDLALFRLALSQLHIRAADKKARIDLEQLIDAFPRDEGGIRAQIKATDLGYVAKKIAPQQALEVYSRHAQEGQTLLLREECLFKQALINHLSAENATSVQQCMQLLREYQEGNLRTEAMALLIQQLPGVIGQLVKNEEFVKALVLAKQNKQLFVRGWIKPDVLFDLARAYSRLGMVDQAAQTYQYLFEITNNATKEQIYRPMIEAMFAAGRYLQVEEYADRYQLRFPKGSDRAPIFLLKAHALYHSGHLDQLIKLLTNDNTPKLPQLELLKGRIYYENKQWPQLIETLEQPQLKKRLAENNLLLPLAEAYFQTNKNDEAQTLFQQLINRDENNEQAQFRLAQIELRRSNSPQALKQFQQLAEKGKDPLWKRLAKEEAAILELRR